jgi:DNA-binding MarR family transcriptional regulator
MTNAKLYEAIGAISAQLRLRYASAGRNEIGFVALATLRSLVRRGPAAVSELAAADRVTTQAISLRVRPLLAAGLVTRETDPGDARRTILVATGPGRALVAEAESGVREALDDAVQQLPAADWQRIEAALPALVRLAGSLEEKHV